MKLKELKHRLTYVSDFTSPILSLEQYITPHDIAACIIYTAHTVYNDIHDKNIVDLCAGTGMLTIATSFYNPKTIKCIEIDSNAIEVLKENCKMFELDNIELINCDINNVNLECDTVFMNPPFGTRNKGVDVNAIEVALRMGNVVYSLHKRTTRDFIMGKFCNATVLAEVEFELKRSHKFHKKEKKYIKVDLYRFVK